ncbi:predicted protein [Arabidopsis lyrata subsp. lyrata]|uniref:Predicted protein n=1 Tax=Arabidopsis lyrata subsp. lyrata TaxID=81972 RepID=D7MV63_ARALL|nr:predicted protein [Arabidopsis lyrata subsp. lyrata]
MVNHTTSIKKDWKRLPKKELDRTIRAELIIRTSTNAHRDGPNLHLQGQMTKLRQNRRRNQSLAKQNQVKGTIRASLLSPQNNQRINNWNQSNKQLLYQTRSMASQLSSATNLQIQSLFSKIPESVLASEISQPHPPSYSLQILISYEATHQMEDPSIEISETLISTLNLSGSWIEVQDLGIFGA